MKIIDLLVDLNNFNRGELVNMPKKIKYNNKIFYFNSGDAKGYYTEKPGFGGESFLKEIMNLNHTVEILEEEKKIPEKLDIRQEKNIKNNWKWKVYGKEHSYNISTPQKIIAYKVNEIIDCLEYFKSKEKGE